LADNDEDVFTVEVDHNTDTWFARPTRQIIQAVARSPHDSYMYVFTRNARDHAARAPHAAELSYVFNNLSGAAARDNDDAEIAQLMNDYWVQFAATGSPNRRDLPNWPVYDLEAQEHKIIGVEGGAGSMLRKAELDELDRYFDERYGSAP
jgi:para-nitrobenzyl esterase